MKIVKALLIVLVAFFMTSCATYSTYYKYDESAARYMNPALKPGFITPIIADLDISNTKITVAETYDNTISHRDINNIEDSPTIEYLKNYTVSKAVKKHNADIITAPIFDIKTSENYDKIEVTVSGYPANYINFKNLNPQILLL